MKRQIRLEKGSFRERKIRKTCHSSHLAGFREKKTRFRDSEKPGRKQRQDWRNDPIAKTVQSCSLLLSGESVSHLCKFSIAREGNGTIFFKFSTASAAATTASKRSGQSVLFVGCLWCFIDLPAFSSRVFSRKKNGSKLQQLRDCERWRNCVLKCTTHWQNDALICAWKIFVIEDWMDKNVLV